MNFMYDIVEDCVIVYYGRNRRFSTMIDVEDLWKLEGMNIIANGKEKRPMVVKGSKRISLLYRFIINAPKGLDVDHIDLNPFNNRKSNLRISTKAENAQNKSGANANSKSGMLNIYYDKTRRKCWLVKIKKNFKTAYSERFELLEDAIKMRDLKRAELFPFSQEAMANGKENNQSKS